MANRMIEIEQIGYRVGSAATANTCSCVGKFEYSVKAKKKTKKCGGAEEVVAVYNTGCGAINIDAHADNDDNEEMMGMADAANKTTVNKRGASRPNVVITAYGTDEDGNKVYVAAPKCLITADESTFTVDNESDEIPYLSQEFEYAPDSNETGIYIKNEEDLPTGITGTQWMTAFDADTMAKA